MSNWSYLLTSKEEEKREEQRKAVESKIEGKKRQFYRSHILHVTVFQGSLQAQFFTILRMPACQNLFYNFRKMQAGQSVAQTSGPKADEAEEDLKKKSTQVLFRSSPLSLSQTWIKYQPSPVSFNSFLPSLSLSSSSTPLWGASTFPWAEIWPKFSGGDRWGNEKPHLGIHWTGDDFCFFAFGGFYKILVIKNGKMRSLASEFI